MLIGLISDSHENMPVIEKAVEHFNAAGVSMVLHAGDIISPYCAKYFRNLKMPLVAVFGNNDCEKTGWIEAVKGWGEIHEQSHAVIKDGHKMLLMHEPRNIDSLAASQQYDIILYGHTHRIDHRLVGKTLIVNPGECGGWITGRSTIAIADLSVKKLEVIELA